MDIKLYRLSYESGRFELDEIDNNLTTTIEDKTLHEHWTVEHFYTVSIKEVEDKLQNATEAAQQLWLCLRRGYRYDEAQIHMKAFREGKTTMKRVVVEDKGGE